MQNMFRIKKVLNHNSVIAIGEGDNREYLVIGKGIAFGKKITERIEAGAEDAVYSLHELNTDRGVATVPSLGKTLFIFALFHSVFQGQICLLVQVFLDFVLLHSSPL